MVDIDNGAWRSRIGGQLGDHVKGGGGDMLGGRVSRLGERDGEESRGCTLAPYSIRLPPSGPWKKRAKMTMA